MENKNKKTRKKEKTKVCVICKDNKKIGDKKKCCSDKMTAIDKGTWNA
ncbi:MAG: hypothetical protein PHV17_08395 [Candidatus Omnitrophica bacterium]|nr:hypothetical protein [Candidatus Omnitrophota bacterium]